MVSVLTLYFPPFPVYRFSRHRSRICRGCTQVQGPVRLEASGEDSRFLSMYVRPSDKYASQKEHDQTNTLFLQCLTGRVLRFRAMMTSELIQ